MCHLMRLHFLLGMTVMILNAGGSDVSSNVSCANISTSLSANTATTPCTAALYFGLSVLGFLILLTLVCQWITISIIMYRKADRTAPVPQMEDKKQTNLGGADELYYATVKFTGAEKHSDHKMKFGPKSEYATVVINTPDLGTRQQDRVDSDICIED